MGWVGTVFRARRGRWTQETVPSAFYATKQRKGHPRFFGCRNKRGTPIPESGRAGGGHRGEEGPSGACVRRPRADRERRRPMCREDVADPSLSNSGPAAEGAVAAGVAADEPPPRVPPVPPGERASHPVVPFRRCRRRVNSGTTRRLHGTKRVHSPEGPWPGKRTDGNPERGRWIDADADGTHLRCEVI